MNRARLSLLRRHPDPALDSRYVSAKGVVMLRVVARLAVNDRLSAKPTQRAVFPHKFLR